MSGSLPQQRVSRRPRGYQNKSCNNDNSIYIKPPSTEPLILEMLCWQGLQVEGLPKMTDQAMRAIAKEATRADVEKDSLVWWDQNWPFWPWFKKFWWKRYTSPWEHHLRNLCMMAVTLCGGNAKRTGKQLRVEAKMGGAKYMAILKRNPFQFQDWDRDGGPFSKCILPTLFWSGSKQAHCHVWMAQSKLRNQSDWVLWQDLKIPVHHWSPFSLTEHEQFCKNIRTQMCKADSATSQKGLHM